MRCLGVVASLRGTPPRTTADELPRAPAGLDVGDHRGGDGGGAPEETGAAIDHGTMVALSPPSGSASSRRERR